MSQALVICGGRGCIGSTLAYGDARVVVCRLDRIAVDLDREGPKRGGPFIHNPVIRPTHFVSGITFRRDLGVPDT